MKAEETVIPLGVPSSLVRGVAESMLKPVPLGKCPPPKADLGLSQGRQKGVWINAGQHEFPRTSNFMSLLLFEWKGEEY